MPVFKMGNVSGMLLYFSYLDASYAVASDVRQLGEDVPRNAGLLLRQYQRPPASGWVR